MKKVILLLYAALSVIPANAIIDINLQMQLGNPSGATADTNNHDHYLVQRAEQALDFSDNLGEPTWASWDLTISDVGTNERSGSFFTDTTLPSNFYRVTDNDYVGVGAIGFNRGHLCPSQDRTDTEAHNDAVFYMSNIIPQSAPNNQGVWATFEDYCRDLATTNELLIICGPSGFGTNRIPSGKAVIATNVWKIAVVVPPGSGTALSRITTTTNRVISMIIPNNNDVTNNWRGYVTSARQIELETGFTFFTALPGPIASAFRAKIDTLTNPPPPSIAGFSPTSGTANTNVVIAGTNFNSTSVVKFNGSNAVFFVDSNTQITTIVPTNATTGFISVTTPGGTATSGSVFTVGADSPPSITTQPTNRTVTAGQNATFIVAASGTAPLAYQWRFAGTNVGGATQSSYTRLNAQSGDAGSYLVVVTNIAGSVTSAVAVLTVNEVSVGTLTTLAGWDVNGLAGGSGNFGPSPLSPTTNAPHLTITGLTRGIGVGTSGTGAARGWGGTSWTNTTSANAIGSNQFFTFTIAAQSGYNVSYSAISKWDYRRSGTGATNGLLQYQIGAGAFTDITNVFYTNTTASGSSLAAIDLTAIAALQSVGEGTNVTFRIVNWGGTSAAGTSYVFDVASNTNLDFAIDGIISTASVVNEDEPYQFLSFSLDGDLATFQWETVSNRTYSLQISTNLVNWQLFATNFHATSATYSFTTNVPFGANFFRVHRAP